VFAIPGPPLDARAEGTNSLLKSGATLVTEPDDILGALAPQLAEPLPASRQPVVVDPEPRGIAPVVAPVALGEVLEADRARLVAALGPAPVDIDELGRATGLAPRALQIALLELALAGRIERHGQQLVSLKA
jgi:DNA processing protein